MEELWVNLTTAPREQVQSCFEQQRDVVSERGRHRAGHLLLLGPVLQPEGVGQRAGLRENVPREFPEPGRLGAGAFVVEPNHPANERWAWRGSKSICAGGVPRD